MDNQPGNQVVGGDSATAQQISVGAELREAREQLGLSVADVSNRIKFAPRQIEALEADDFVRLPEAAFVRGFVRSYARLLEIDAAPLLTALPQTHMQQEAVPEKKSVDVPYPTVLTSRRSSIAWLAGALVVALVLVVFSRMHDSSSDPVPRMAQPNVEVLELPAIAAVSAPLAAVPPAEAAVPVVVPPKHAAPVTAVPEQAQIALTPQNKDKPAKEPLVKEKVAQEQTGGDMAAQERAAKKQAAKEQAAQERAAKKQAAKEQAAQEQAAREQAAQERAAKKQAAKEQAAQERAAKKAAREQAAREQAAQAPKPGNGASELASLRLVFDEDSWADVNDATGKILLSKMNRAGSLVRLSGTAPLTVVIGHASGVHLFYKGKEVRLAPHTSGEVARISLE